MRDNFESFIPCEIGVPASKTATFTSSPVDLDISNSVTVLYIVGAASSDTLSGSVYWTCTLTECATVGGTYTAVAAADIIDGSEPATNSVVIDADGECGLTYKLGYKGDMRFLRGVMTPTGTHTYGHVLGMVAIQGDIRMGAAGQASVVVAS